MTKRQKNVLRFSKIIIIVVITLVLIFTGSVLYVFNNKGSEPTAIITAFFAFMTGEILALAKLKLAEISAEISNKKIDKNIKEKEKDGNSI